MKDIAKFLNQVLASQHAAPNIESRDQIPPPIPVKKQIAPDFLPSNEVVYKTTPTKPKYKIEVVAEDDDDHDVVREEVKDCGRKNFGEIGSSYVTPYLYNRLFFDKQYSIGGRTTEVLRLLIPRCLLTARVLSL